MHVSQKLFTAITHVCSRYSRHHHKATVKPGRLHAEMTQAQNILNTKEEC